MRFIHWLLGLFGLARIQKQPDQLPRPISPVNEAGGDQAYTRSAFVPRPGITFASRSLEQVNGMPLPQLGELSVIEETATGHVQETTSHQRVTLGDGSLRDKLSDDLFCCTECISDLASIEGVQDPQAHLPQTFWPNAVAVRLMSGRLACPNHAVLVAQDPMTGAAIYISPRELAAMQKQQQPPMLTRLKHLMLGSRP